MTVELDTVVQSVGEIENEASVFPNQKSIDDDEPIVTDPAEVKYGSYLLKKNSSDNTVTGASLAGASASTSVPSASSSSPSSISAAETTCSSLATSNSRTPALPRPMTRRLPSPMRMSFA